MSKNNKLYNLLIEYHRQMSENELFVIVDKNMQIIAEHPHVAQLLNYKKPSMLGEHILKDVPVSSWRAGIINNIIRDCFNNNRKHQYLTLRFTRDPHYWLLILTYKPIQELTKKKVLAVKITAEIPDYPLNFYALSKIISSKQNTPPIEQENSQNLLNTTEHEILFALFYNKTYQEIADILTFIHKKQYTAAAVAKQVSRNLYEKFDVTNLQALKKEAHNLGYHTKLPMSLFNEFIFPITEI